jgi:hypothetical protein
MPSIQLFVLNSFNKEYSMSLIQCPYCQSTHVRQTDSSHANANYFEQLQRCISPTQMALFGMQLAKKAGFRLLQAQPSVLWWVVYWLLSVSTAMKNITAMPSSISAWIANNVCMGAVIASQTLHGYIFE